VALIELTGVRAAYPVIISSTQRSAFASAANTMSFGRVGRMATPADYIFAVNDVSLSLRDGQRLGIMGRNGSGKSTLLRLIAGILPPTAGQRRVDGTLGCVLSSVGLDPDKTGVQNMRFIGRLYGMSGRQLETALEEAIDFSGLGPYVDMPIRTYSSGMMQRLSYSMATARSADIMLIDEMIGTGDTSFIAKAIERARNICDNAGISVVASHSDQVLRGFSDIGIWMDSGRIRAVGEIDEVIATYTQFLLSIGEI
jgi:ABC-type polysaccharide/polyol phosphate transport system ATPase subunit